MPIYMDLHTIPGVTAKDVAEVHAKDVLVQEEYGCRCMTYWIDEDKGSVFCLIDAPEKNAVIKMHSHSHGLVPHEIIQVNTNVVEAFLGRIQDPPTMNDSEHPDLKIFNDPAFRTIMVTKTMDGRLLQNVLGKNKADELLSLYSNTIREHFKKFGGREVEWEGEEFVASFVSVSQGIECAMSIQNTLQGIAENIRFCIGLHAGMPVKQSELLFGSTVKLAKYLCSLGNGGQILVSSVIRNHLKDSSPASYKQMRWLTNSEENFLEALMDTLATCWHNPQFDIEGFCRHMSMSKPQLYRKSKSLTGLSPNTLLRDYRLLQSLDLLKKEDRNIAQTTFDSGFSSPSYFTKCFYKKFGLQPLAYLKSKE